MRGITLHPVSNVLSEEKKKQVIALGQLGWALRRIEEATGVRRETAAGYLKAAGISIRAPGGWGRRKAKPANEVTTGSEAAKPANADEMTTGLGAAEAEPTSTTSTSEPYRELIEAGLWKGRNAVSIWQDLVDRHGFTGAYESVKRYVRKLRGTQSPQARAIIQTAPGEEAQVDYGTGPMVRDAQTGKYRRTRLFVLTLGFSRKCIRLLCFHSSTRIWAELHEQAFRRLGGSTKVVVLDNLKEGVLMPDIYDPGVNPLYRDVLAHYGVVAMPCRIQDPDRKGKVESGVAYAKKTPLRGQRFESLAAAQSHLDHWESAGPINAFTAARSGRWPPCLPKRNPRCSRCRWNRFATTNTANEPYIWTGAWKLKQPTTARRRAGSGA
jgi:transposase